MPFFIIVESKEALYGAGCIGNPIATKEGDKFAVTNEPGGWVPATSSRWIDKVPGDILTFDTIKEAGNFARKWKGHPWWCKPNGKYEIKEVKPKMVTRQEGWVEV